MKRPKKGTKAKAGTGAKAGTRARTGLAAVDKPVKLGNPRMGWASDVVAEVTRRIGFKYLALVPGASYRGFHDSLVNYLGNRDPQMVICLHEEHSVAIADGYGKVTGEPMAVAIHTNVGLMHATMAIFSAFTDRTPMVIFGANGPIDAHRRRPWIDWIHTTKDHAQLIRNYIKWDDEPQSPEAAVESVLRANQIARAKPTGPTYVALDAGLQETPLDREVKIPDLERYAPGAPPAADRKTLGKVIAAIKKAKAPLMMMGRLGHDQRAWDNRIRLAEALGCAVMTHMRAGAVFPTEHPCHIAPPCFRPQEVNKALVRKADLLVNFDWLDFGGFLRLCTGAAQTQAPHPGTIIQVSLDQYLHNGWNMDYQALPAADINVLADPDTFIAQMLDELGVKGAPKGKAKLKPALARLPHWTKSEAAKARPGASGPMTPKDFHLVASEFMAAHPKAAMCRMATGFPGTAARFRTPWDFIGNDGGGGVGSGPGQSVGMALALTDMGRLPVSFLGDGDYLMGVNALWSAAHARVPLLVVVMNNRSYYNDEAHQHHVAEERGRAPENRWIGLRLDDPAPDLAGLARAQGFEAAGPITGAKAFRAALEKGLEVVAKGGRYMVDAVVAPEDALSRRRQDGGRGHTSGR